MLVLYNHAQEYTLHIRTYFYSYHSYFVHRVQFIVASTVLKTLKEIVFCTFEVQLLVFQLQ